MTTTFVQVPLSVLDAQDISLSVRMVYMRLLAHRNRKTHQCNPKFSTLARELGVSYKTVCRAIKKLREMGVIRAVRNRIYYAFELVESAFRKWTKCPLMSGQNVHSQPAPSLLTEPDEMKERKIPPAPLAGGRVVEEPTPMVAASAPEPAGGAPGVFPQFQIQDENQKPKPAWESDVSYAPIVEVAREFWSDSMPEDFVDAHRVWKHLAERDKSGAIARLKAKQAVCPGLGNYTSKNFARYMTSPEWKRDARKPVAAVRVDPALAILARMRQRDAGLRDIL
jgi:biotin operon repressor